MSPLGKRRRSGRVRCVKQLLKPLSDAVGALYKDWRADKELTRKTIPTQLEAARWLDFDRVKAA
jgi:hypothetical protein